MSDQTRVIHCDKCADFDALEQRCEQAEGRVVACEQHLTELKFEKAQLEAQLATAEARVKALEELQAKGILSRIMELGAIEEKLLWYEEGYRNGWFSKVTLTYKTDEPSAYADWLAAEPQAPTQGMGEDGKP